MAKQSGIHQLRGKVGEHSYYRQSGIASGLVRGINPAMSGRVKNGDEYANTRLNNAEFRNAAELASAMGGIIHPKYRPMILPFSQSKLTKAYLALIKEASGQWGQRNVVVTQHQRIADHLNELAKIRYEEMFVDVEPVEVPLGQTSDEVTVGFSGDQATSLISMGISGVKFRVTPVRLLVGEYDPSIGRNRATFATLGEAGTADMSITLDTPDTVDIPITPGTANAPGYVGMLFAIVVALPYRTVGESSYILQEYCSFKCVPVTYAV